MKIIILGGNAASNRLWVRNLAKHAAKETEHDVYSHIYKHWQTHVKFIDIDYELQALATNNVLTGNYVIIAKSMGSLLALKGIYTGPLKPIACLFLGFPLEIIHEADLPAATWSTRLQGDMQFIQNKYDPLGSYADVAGYLITASVAPYRIVQWPGTTHEYADTTAIVSALISALQAASREPH